jgi:hypothetical protein
VNVPNKGPHPAVVLYIEAGMMVVAVGSTTPIADTEVPKAAIDRDPALSQMRLRSGDTTRFYQRHIQPMEWSNGAFEIWGKCPAGIFDRLFAAMEQIARESLAGARTISPIPRHALSLVKQLEQMVSRPAAVSPTMASDNAVESNAEPVRPSKPSHDA